MKKALFLFAAQRKSLRRFTLAMGLSTLMVSSHLNAQMPVDLIANVPFTFQIGPTRMPAGTYVIHQKDDVLTVRQPGNGGRAVVLMTLRASRDSAPRTGVLEFHRYGESYFLANVWNPLASTGSALPEGSPEKELASRIAPFQKASIQAKTE